jgi:hypothetical protein
VSKSDSGDESQVCIRVVVRPYASALPLGCFAFGVGNALVGALGLHWIPGADTREVAVMLLAFVAPLELVPCFFGFLSRDAGSATAMGIFAASWVVQGIRLLGPTADSDSPAVGIFLFMLAVFILILAFVSFAEKPLLGVLLVVALLRSVGAALVHFGIHGAVDVTTAILALILTVFSVYCGLGFLMEDIKQLPLPMMFRQGKAKAAMEGDLQYQLKRVSREAGVRQQL